MPTKKSVKMKPKPKAKKVVKKPSKSPVKKTTTIPAKKITTIKKKDTKAAKLSPREKKLQNIKKNLLDQKKSLLVGAVEALNELPGPIVFPDLGDQASAEIDRNFMLKLRGRERKLLKKIDEAIERIESKTFGICEKCGLEIDIRRLEARPVTTMCIECKILQEEEEKMTER